jgi:outer membrane protein assembly factor BamD (BamD/ComL family)
MMCKHPIWLLGLVLGATLPCWPSVGAETWRLKNGEKWESVSANPQEQFLHDLAQLKELTRGGNFKEIRTALRQLRADFPDRTGEDLELFIYGEMRYWQNHWTKALIRFEMLLKDYPGSQYAGPALQREFDMAQAYLQGRKKTVLGLFKISGAAEGLEMMEKISDRAGLDEPNGVGVRAAIAVAEHYEANEQYFDAYLKWSEIASYWETGPIAKQAIYRMAEDNVAAYNRYPPAKRSHYDASKLTTARTYYEKFLALYPQEGKEKEIPEKIRQIDEQMAYKQFTIGKFYARTGKRQAANLYFDMIVRNWPKTEAAVLAREALEESANRGSSGGK